MPVAKTRLEKLQICKLLQCVREEDREQIEKLTVNGIPGLINFNEPNNGETPLTIAAAANNEAMIAFLLELGADPDMVDLRGRTPAMRAAEYGHVQCMERLAKAGANMKAVDLQGKGTIFYCINCTQRHEKCLEIALVHGAEVNNVSKDGVPSFVEACETAKDNEEMCLMLLKKGADPNSKTKKLNRTALMAACGSGSARVVRAILEKGADNINEIQLRPKVHAGHEAAKSGCLDGLKTLSAYGAVFDHYDEQGNNPIHYGAKAGHAMCCKFLGQRGCNPKPKNADGYVPRVLAKEEGHKEAVKECRKVEKTFGKTGKNNEPWALSLYDYCHERHEQFMEMYTKFDGDGTGMVSKEDFTEGLTNMGAPLPDENEIKRLLALHDKNHDHTVDYADFLTGKKYVNKFYLMSAFEAKKKKVPTATLR